MGRTISILSPLLRRVSAYCVLGVISRLMATAVYSRLTMRWSRSPSMLSPSGSSTSLPLTLTTIKKPHLVGCGSSTLEFRVAFPSLELPSAGSRGPGPHPVLRRPPPAPRAGLYPSVELGGERGRLRDRELADVAPTDVGGGLAIDGGTVREQGQAGPGGRPRAGADHDTIRPVPLERSGDERPAIRAFGPDEGDLRDRTQVEVERGEVPSETGRVSRHQVGHGSKGPGGDRLVALLAEEDSQAEQPVDGHGGAAGHGIVEEIARPDYEGVVVPAGVEEHALAFVPEELEGALRELARLVEPAAVEGRLVQREQTHADHGVVLEIALDLRLPVLPRAEQSALRLHLRHQEVCVLDGGGQVVRPLQHAARLGKGGESETVPRGEDLVVEAGVHAPLAHGVQSCARAPDQLHEPLFADAERLRGDLGWLAGNVENAVPLEVRPAVHAPVGERRATHLGIGEGPGDLLGRPHEELPLDPLGIGVLSGEEAARSMRHLAQDVVECFL